MLLYADPAGMRSKDDGERRRLLAFALPAMFFRDFSLPFSDRGRVRRSLEMEVEAELPGGLSSYRILPAILSREGGKAFGFYLALRKRALEEVLSAAGRVDLAVPAPFCLRAFAEAELGSFDEPTLLGTASGESGFASVFAGRRLLYYRFFYLRQSSPEEEEAKARAIFPSLAGARWFDLEGLFEGLKLLYAERDHPLRLDVLSRGRSLGEVLSSGGRMLDASFLALLVLSFTLLGSSALGYLSARKEALALEEASRKAFAQVFGSPPKADPLSEARRALSELSGRRKVSFSPVEVLFELEEALKGLGVQVETLSLSGNVLSMSLSLNDITLATSVQERLRSRRLFAQVDAGSVGQRPGGGASMGVTVRLREGSN